MEPTPVRPSYDMVVIASSAGGIAALSQVVGALPADFPARLVIVQHLDPRHRSLIDQILSRRSKLPVRQVTSGEAVEPGTVFVAPPDNHVLVGADGTFTLSRAQLVHFVRPSADLLFESVAGSYGERVIGVVLTGTGSDGSMGVEAVKKAGGTVIVQDQSSSQFFGMPEAAIRTGVVDFILPLEEIGPAIVTLVVGGRP